MIFEKFRENPKDFPRASQRISKEFAKNLISAPNESRPKMLRILIEFQIIKKI